MSYISDCLEKFSQLPSDLKKRIGGAEVVEKIENLEKQFQATLSFAVILVAIRELKIDDLPEFLSKDQDIQPEKAKIISRELLWQVFSKIFDNEVQFKLLTNNGIKDIFAENLNDLLSAADELREEFNEKLKIELALASEEELKNLVHSLETNQEVLTSAEIILSGRRVSPTVENWLKAFILYHGVEIFDSLIISKYITTSDNAKSLNSDERAKLKDILNLYRGIKFFPDSMLDLPIKKWKFINFKSLLDDDSETKERIISSSSQEKSDAFSNQSFSAPDSVFSPWIASDYFQENLKNIIKKHGLSLAQVREFKDPFLKYIDSQIDFNDFYLLLKKKLALNSEAIGLFLRDVLGYLVKPVAKFVPDYSNSLLEDFGAQRSDYSLTADVSDILNQIAISKEAVRLSEKDNFAKQEREVQAKKIEAFESQQDKELAKKLEDKLKEIYKKSKTPEITSASAQFSKLADNPDEFTKQFYQAINDRQADRVIGALWVLAENGKLFSLLVDDQKIQKLYFNHLAKKYSQPVADDFSFHPDAPAYFSYFLQHLLVDTIKMSSAEAAALAIHLVNEFNKSTGADIELLSYGDMETQEFVWRSVVSQDNKLILAD